MTHHYFFRSIYIEFCPLLILGKNNELPFCIYNLTKNSQKRDHIGTSLLLVPLNCTFTELQKICEKYCFRNFFACDLTIGSMQELPKYSYSCQSNN